MNASAAAAPAVAMEAPIATLAFAHLPSVGTWMQPLRPVRHLEDTVAEEDVAVAASELRDVADARQAEEEVQTPRSELQRKVAGAFAAVVGVAQLSADTVVGAAQMGAGRVVGVAEMGADRICEKWQATDEAATKALVASEQFLSRKADAISEVAAEKKDIVQQAVTGRARQGYAFALEKTRPIRQAADYAKEKLEAVTDAIHDKTAAGVHAGGKRAERVTDKISDGIGLISGKAEDLTVSMAAKANRGISYLSAQTAAVKQTSKVAAWATRASGA